MNAFQSASLTMIPEGERIQLIKSPFFIGSESQLCDFSTRDAGLSPLNAELKLVDDHWEIRVYPGSKRVHLNHNLLTEDVFFLMNDGDTLDIGGLNLTFRHVCLFSESEQAAMMAALYSLEPALAPEAWAARTYSCSRRERIWPRIRRDMETQ